MELLTSVLVAGAACICDTVDALYQAICNG